MTTHELFIGVDNLFSDGYVRGEVRGKGDTIKSDCPCNCPCCTPSPEASDGPVRYNNGELLYSAVDLAAGGFGAPWGHTRLFSNRLDFSQDMGQGFNWLIDQWPYLVNEGDTIIMMKGLSERVWFDESGGGYYAGSAYTTRYGVHHKLEHDETNNIFKVKIPAGGLLTFHDFDQTDSPKGLFESYETPGGQVVSADSYTSAGNIQEIIRSFTEGSSTTTESFYYEYNSDDRLQYITLRRKVDAGSWDNIRRVEYAYYGSSESYGTEGDLKTVKQQVPDGQGGWTTTDTTYYRYYKNGDADGFSHALKYVIEPEAYQRLDDAVADPLAATNAQVADYADYLFKYDTYHRVVEEQLNGGSHTRSFVYTRSGNTNGPNNWDHKTVETRPDNSEIIVYTNHLGQVLVRELKDGNDSWIEYSKYNSDYSVILRASPSAATSYDDSEADLDVSLKATSGLIRVTDYYTTDTGGGAKGHVQYEKIKQGSTGTEVKQRKYEYTLRTVDDHTIDMVSKETVYRNDDGTGAIDTSYSYSWHTGTLQIEERVTTLPAISTSQNGSGTSNTRTERFDSQGNLIWSKDERGFIHRNIYDAVTGVLTQSIQDVDTTAVSDEPSGWSTPSGGGKHLVSDLEYDDLGRLIQTLGPEHEVDIGGTATDVRTASWTVYDDENREVRSAQGYATGVSWDTFTLVNPVSITKMDRTGRSLEEIVATRTSTSGKLSDSDTFAQTSYVRWSTSSYDDEGKLEHTRIYHTIPSSGAGTSGTNYDQTSYGYDTMSRQNRVTSPGGTISRTVFKNVGRTAVPASTYIGTDDTSATETDPTGGGTTGNNMVLVSEPQYDSGLSGGDGLLTKQTEHVDSSTKRETSFTYDWRNRQTDVDGEEDFYQISTYDNLGHVTRVDRHDTTSTGNLIARAESKFDDLGRVYQTKRYAVDVSTGTVGNSLTDNTWFDAAGNVIKEHPAGSEAFTKFEYDSLGRQVKQFIGFDVDETSDADDVVGDTIFEQSETDYDDASNLIEKRLGRRHHDATGTGELTTPSGSNPKARVSYLALYSDAVGRQIAVANYGTNDDTSLSRSSTIPTRSDDILVTSTDYNDDGEAYKVTDPADKEDRTEFDDAGRVTKQIENYTDGDPTNGGTDEDITVEFTYTADGQQATLTAKQKSSSDDQTTKYIYGTSLSDSDIARSDVLRAVIYPDSDDTGTSGTPATLGDGTDSTYDRVEHKYNRQGEVTETKDQNGTIHTVFFDDLGRQTHDRVTALGTDIDNSVLRLSRTYEVRGMLEKASSYDNATVGSGNVVNEVKREYNNFGQLVTEYQEHGAAVNTSTSPKVQYSYTDGSSNHIRRTKMTYPNGRILRYEYNSGDDDNLSRVSFLADDDNGNVGPHLAEYTYLGLSDFVQVDYTEPDIRMDLAHGNGNDPYDGLDDFDRVVDLLWRDYGGSTDVVRIQHGYDRAGNRLYREDPVAAANSKDFDELYSYDGVNRLTNMKRGDLNSTKDGISSGTLTFEQDWSLDSLGNWSAFKEDTDGDSSWNLNQSRSHNRVNEVTDIDSSSSHVAHDRNGNMRKISKPDNWSAHFDLTWDAWNRLLKVEDGASTIAEYAYDGLTRRVIKDAGSTVRHFYYTASWQAIEEQLDSSTDVERQFIWGLRYIDDLILRDRDTSDPQDGTADERLYSVQDPLWNIVAAVSEGGAVQERLAYAAFGDAQISDQDFVARTSSVYDWDYMFTGRRIDVETSLYCFRARYLHARLGRFVGRDPKGFVDGPSLYRTYFVFGGVDPLGLEKVLTQQIKDENGKVCGTVHITLELGKAKEGDRKGLYFRFMRSELEGEDKCMCCKSGKYGWVQHIRQGKSWYYDNELSIVRAATSNPNANPQPITRPDKPAKEMINPNAPLKPLPPGFPRGWKNNPWYGGKPAPNAEEYAPVHGWESAINLFTNNFAFDRKFIEYEKGKGRDPKERKWKVGITIFWAQNPFPQQTIFDAPTAGQHFITQLVCAGDISGKGNDAGKVLAQFSWNSDDVKGSIRAVKVPDFKDQ